MNARIRDMRAFMCAKTLPLASFHAGCTHPELRHSMQGVRTRSVESPKACHRIAHSLRHSMQGARTRSVESPKACHRIAHSLRHSMQGARTRSCVIPCRVYEIY